jgi:hypothetical protein
LLSQRPQVLTDLIINPLTLGRTLVPAAQKGNEPRPSCRVRASDALRLCLAVLLWVSALPQRGSPTLDDVVMTGNAWTHLQEAVDALVAAGNAVEPPGFHPTQGGWSCEMTGPLDPEVAASLADSDPVLTYERDELSCRHCWTVIVGGEARARIRRAYDAAATQVSPGLTGNKSVTSSGSGVRAQGLLAVWEVPGHDGDS